MPDNALKTLLYPFETGELPSPGDGLRVLFLGAPGGLMLPADFRAEITCVQGFRPDYLRLQKAGRTVSPEAEGENFDMALVLAGRHRALSELRVAEALERVRPGGLVVIAGSNDDGIASLRKRLSGLIPVDGHLPKYHGIAFWLTRPTGAASAIDTLRTANPQMLVDGRFHVGPGMFSAGRVDRGSLLLADHLPLDIKGTAADFCAGWGYIAARAAERLPNLKALDLYEADHASLEAARLNLSSVAMARFCWHDVAAEPIETRYDVILMNPPFHTARSAEPDLGQSMIQAASRALKRGGRLFLVANRQLPYERTLAETFNRHRQVFGDGVFKLFEAVK